MQISYSELQQILLNKRFALVLIVQSIVQKRVKNSRKQ